MFQERICPECGFITDEDFICDNPNCGKAGENPLEEEDEQFSDMAPTWEPEDDGLIPGTYEHDGPLFMDDEDEDEDDNEEDSYFDDDNTYEDDERGWHRRFD